VPLESYQLYSQIVRSKAWIIARYLEKRGFDSIPSGAIPLKTAAVKCGLGCQGKNTLLVTPTYGPRVRLVAVLTTAELDIDEPYKEDLCKDCERCVLACPAKAIEPYKLKVNKCMVYASENPHSADVSDETRELEKRLVKRPTLNSFIDCTTCLEACPIGKTAS
jgi:epoxyqueuosine reductase